MKKLLFAIYVACIASNIGAYTITFNNDSPYPLQAEITYGGAGWCTPDNVVIPARAAGAPTVTRTHNTAACCSKMIQVRRVDMVADTTWNFQPPSTGFGLSCKSYSVNISSNPDGTLNLMK